MTPQEQLTAKIREALPNLMELKENCVLENNNQQTLKLIDASKEYFVLLTDNGFIYYILKENIEKQFTIIGAEPTLNDVLMYLDIIKFDDDEDMNYIEKITNRDFVIDKYNLQLPYSQQSDEWFNFMLGL